MRLKSPQLQQSENKSKLESKDQKVGRGGRVGGVGGGGEGGGSCGSLNEIVSESHSQASRGHTGPKGIKECQKKN